MNKKTEALYKSRIKKYFPELKIKSLKLITVGYNHDVVIINDEVVFRFIKGEKCSKEFLKEIKFLDYFSKNAKIPIPGYYFISKDKSFGAYKLIKGSEMSESFIRKLKGREKNVFIKDLADFLTQLHKVPLKKARKFDFDKGSFIKDRKERFQKRKKTIFKFLSKEEKDFMTNFYKNIPKLLAHPSKVLTHLDLDCRHILVDKKKRKMTGIIDFEALTIRDPASEFYWFRIVGEKFTKELYEKYSGPKDDRFLLRTKYYAMIHLFEITYDGIKGKTKIDIDKNIRLLKSLISTSKNK